MNSPFNDFNAHGYHLESMQNHGPIIPPLCHIPSGPFLMGSNPEKDIWCSQVYELPQHTILVSGYAIGTYPVSVFEYNQAVINDIVPPPASSMGITWEEQLHNPNNPVVCVTWKETLIYCNWLNHFSDYLWRLPTEAEWEKASRGLAGAIYPWGDVWDKNRSNSTEGGIGHVVSIFDFTNGMSIYGVSQMSGNIWEWCSSLARPYPYVFDNREDLTLSGNRILRGGSWAEDFKCVRSAFRYDDVPERPYSHAGFRVVANLSP